MPIEQKEIFISTIEKMYWIEVEMENLGIWEARIELMEEEKESIDILASDSARHKIALEKWMKAANMEIPTSAPLGLPRKEFDFSGMDNPEMFKEIMKYEILAKNIYKDIIDTSPTVLNQVFPDKKQISEFLTNIEEIIEDEERHENICRQNVGGFQTIIGKGR